MIVEKLVVAVGYAVDLASMRSALGGFVQMTAAAGALTAAVVGATIAQAAHDDELTKTAHDLGMTTEAYTALTFAMDREGITQEKLNGSLRQLQSNLEAAARGGGEAAAWFRQMEISAQDAATGGVRSVADVLPELARGLGGLDEGALKGASIRIFGENGLRMGRALAKGTDNLNDLIARANELGIVLDEEAGANAEALTDAMTDLRAAVSGVAARITRGLTPAITPLVLGLADWIAKSELVEVVTTKATDAMRAGLEALDRPVGRVVAGIGTLALAVGGASAASSLIGAAKAASPVLAALAGTIALPSASMLLLAAGAVGVALVLEDLAVAADGGDSAVMHMAESMGYGTEAQALLAQGMETGSEVVGMLSAAWQAASATGEVLAGWMQNLGRGTLFAAAQLWKAWEATEGLRGAIAESNPVLAVMLAYFRAVGRAMAYAFDKATDFGNATSGYLKLAESLRDRGGLATLGTLAQSAIDTSVQSQIGLFDGASGALADSSVGGVGPVFRASRFAGMQIGSGFAAAREAFQPSFNITVEGGVNPDQAREAGRRVERELLLAGQGGAR